MLRKLVITHPKPLNDDAIEACRVLEYGLDDYGWIKEGDTSYGPYTGPDIGFVSVVHDDTDVSGEQVLEQIRAAFPAEVREQFAIHLHWVYMPDGLDKEFYEGLWPACEALRLAEASGDVETAMTLRAQLVPVLEAAEQQAEVNLTAWKLDMGKALGGITIEGDGMRDVLGGVAEALRRKQAEEAAMPQQRQES